MEPAMNFSFEDHPHRRFNPLLGQWILVSPHRTKRPWQGQVERLPSDARPQYDPHCYLCPGNKRAGNAANPKYGRTFVFTNDFSALLPDTPGGKLESDGLFQVEPVRGECRV